MFRTSNPTLRSRYFEQAVGAGHMTLAGTLGKSGVLLAILLVAAAVGWAAQSPILMLGGVVVALVLSLVTAFKPQWSPMTAPLFAAFEGVALGGISAVFAERLADTQYAGAVPLAVLGTITVLGVMLGLYATRIIRVSQTFLAVTLGATIAIGLTYLVTFVLSFFWPGVAALPIYSSGPIGLAFSCIAIVVAAMNLAVDFKVIEDGVNGRAPKYMEWYASFGLLVTLVWLYLELLRLIAKLAGNRS